MDKFTINGPCKLNGTVAVSAAKNAALPIMAATLLYPGKIKFNNLPELADIKFFTNILEDLGARCIKDDNEHSFQCDDITSVKADYELVRKMRASVLVLGPLLSRFGKAEVSLPGGCAIGARPVDIHLKGLEKLGAEIEIKEGYIFASCDELKGAVVELPFPSVGATENIMMAAAFAKGSTVIENAAKEPEIIDLANFMKQMGIPVQGEGTAQLTIQGIDKDSIDSNREIEYSIIGDRIEAATYIIAGLISKSEVKVMNFNPQHIEAVTDVLIQMGAKLEIGNDYVKTFDNGRLRGVNVDTAPYPGYPTDVQAQLMALMCVSEGNSTITENIFENRYMHVPELVRMGAKIELRGSSAIVTGVDQLTAAPVMCTDLRASAALVLSSLVATGNSSVSRIYHIDRGYENLSSKLSAIGANILREKA